MQHSFGHPLSSTIKDAIHHCILVLSPAKSIYFIKLLLMSLCTTLKNSTVDTQILTTAYSETCWSICIKKSGSTVKNSMLGQPLVL